jgi:alkaline phosphatase
LYDVEFTYNGGQKTHATWEVRELAKKRKAKNVVMFIGDGMTQSMITAARLLAHKTVGGKYMSR